jgi:HTH-type transcriptional regulator, glycine betaine synthesis regulator
MMAVGEANLLESGVASAEGSELSSIEVEAIDLFVSAVRLLGLPRSLGELYGLLFISPGPLSIDDLVERLRISKGSASQGLKALRQIGAVKVTYVPGDRRDHYIAETELKRLALGFINGQMLPHLETTEARLVRLRELEKAANLHGITDGVYRDKIERLEYWHSRARNLVPLIGKLLD